MSTIAEKLTLLNQTKTDIKAAIEEKGQTVGNMVFSQYANKVRAIKGLSPVTPSSASTADVTEKLNRLNSTKADIQTAIEACGVPVGSIPFSQYADKIRAIQIDIPPKTEPAYRITDECVMCRACLYYCPVNAIVQADSRYVITNDCVGCGSCVDECPVCAICETNS